jgi:diadenylate cyclase
MTAYEIFNNLLNYIRPVLEIGVLTFLIYGVLYFLRGTRATSILAGIIIVLIILTVLSDAVKFEVINWLLSSLWGILATAMLVIFQPELRRAFAQLGTTPFTNRKIKKKEAINEVVNAVLDMSRQRIGSIIVFERQIGMASIVNNAVQLDIKLNNLLLQSIFYPNSPLHDGAVIVKNDKIIAAHAILPLTQDESLVQSLGTRHRAGIGITEETDAVVVICSEETGMVSIACRGRLKRDIKPDKILRYLSGLLISGNDASLKNIFGTMAQNDESEEGFTGKVNND